MQLIMAMKRIRDEMIFLNIWKASLGSFKLNFWQAIDDFLGFQAYGHDAKKQVEDVTRFPVLYGPIVGVTTFFMGRDLIAVHDPFDGAAAVDYVVVHGQRNMSNTDIIVINEDGLVLFRFEFQLLELHSLVTLFSSCLLELS